MKRFSLSIIIALLAGAAAFVSAQTIDPGPGVKLTDTKMYFPAWSPDGKWIASCGGFDGVWITPAEGGASIKLVDKPTVDYKGTKISFMVTRKMGFTPDGKEILYTSFLIDESRGTTVAVWKPAAGNEIRNEIPVVMAVNIETKQTRVIREEADRARYSHDGKYFAYVNYDHRAITEPGKEERHRALAVQDVQTGATKYFFGKPDYDVSVFEFSGDDSYIVAIVTNLTDKKRYVYRIPLNGGAPVDITWWDNPWKCSIFDGPECSPDGKWIMYNGWNDPIRMLFIYNTATGKTTAVFPPAPVRNTDGVWSPDGKKICCMLELDSTGRGGLYRFDFVEADLGKYPALAEAPLPIPSQYGKRFLSIDLSTMTPQDSLYGLYRSLNKTQYHSAWSPDGKWIAISDWVNKTMWKIPMEGGLPRRIVNFDRTYEYKQYKISVESPMFVEFTRDGKEIVYDSRIIDESRGTVVTITEGTTPGGGSHFGVSLNGLINVVKAVNVETGATRIIQDSAASGVMSNNQRWLAYKAGKDSIMLLDISTGKSKLIATGMSKLFCFSPDDSYVIGGNTAGCWKLPVDGSSIMQLFSGSCYSVSLSPDGRSILYGTSAGLYIFDMGTGKSYDFILNQGNFRCSEGKFSPDGKKVSIILNYSGDDSWNRIFIRDFDPSDIGLKTEVAESAPLSFALKGNFPNPFNPSTTIGFSLPSPGRVNLAVYDITGRKVRELVSGAMPAGTYSAAWDGKDGSGKAVSSGVYISRLTQGEKAVSRRMLLVK